MGRIGAIVKGIRKREGKFGSALEPMSWVQLVVYVKESREVQTVAQCDLLQSFHHISGDLDKISIGLALVEIVNTIAHEQEQNIPLFDLLKNSLVYLEEAETNISWVLFYFELKLAELLGFNPVFNFCGNCKKAITLENGTKWQMYNLLKGSPVCDGCSSSGECRTGSPGTWMSAARSPKLPDTLIASSSRAW